MIYLVSNGYGEDLISVSLGHYFLERGFPVQAAPLIGEGLAFKQAGIPVLFSSPISPTGGFLRDFKSLLTDIRFGMLGRHWKQFRVLKNLAQNQTWIVIGDVFAMMFSALASQKQVFFLPTAKSSKFMPHSRLEYALMRRYTRYVYPRDTLSANDCQAANLRSKSFGNVMMDMIQIDQQKRPDSWGLALLPGSRNESYGNLNLILSVVTQFKDRAKDFRFIFAKSQHFDLRQFKSVLNSEWRYWESKHILHHSITGIEVDISESFNEVLSHTHMAIGLAGTANEQAVYANREVFAFPGTGAQSSYQRFEEQSRLLGSKLRLINSQNPRKIAACILEHVQGRSKDWPIFEAQKKASRLIGLDILKRIE